MKKTILNLMMFLVSGTSLFAQLPAGKVTYFFNRDAKIDIGGEMNEAQKQQMIKSLKKQFEKTFILEFSGYESTYEEKAELQNESGSNVQLIIVGGSSGKLYKSTKEKIYIKSDESLGKRFLIIDSLKKQDWQLIDSTKYINQYLCYKARCLIKENQADTLIEIPVTAWYAPDIPVNNGPEKFWGLPGLILEIQQGNITIACKKIELNTKGIKINKPEKGKKVNQKEFDKILNKKIKQIQEMNEGGRQKGNENTIEIKIGG